MQSSSSRTTMPPEPMMAPASWRESKSTGRSSADSGRQPPDGPPIWTALNFFRLGDAAAHVEDDLAQGGAHGHLDQAGIHDLACQGEDGRARAALRADAGEPVRPVIDDVAHVGQRLDVVDQGRLAVKAALGRDRAGGGGACRRGLRGRRSGPSPRRRRRRPSPRKS